MASNTQPRPSGRPLEDLLANLPGERRRTDTQALIALMRTITGHEPIVWGQSMIGFGHRTYRYAGGRDGETFELGFAANGREISIYTNSDLSRNPHCHDLLAALGPHRTGVAHLFLKQLQQIDMAVLEQLLRTAHADVLAAAQ
jgi:hypothetical protein